LAGGLGTRLSPIIGIDTPKILASVNGRPFLEILLDFLQTKKFTDVVFSLGHLSEKVRVTLSQPRSDLPIRVVEESSPLGTGGAAVFASRASSREFVLVMNGDTIVDFELNSLLGVMTDDTAAVLGLSHQPGSSTSAKFNLTLGKVGAVEEGNYDPDSVFTHAGVTLIRRSVLQEFISQPTPFGFEATVLAALVSSGLVAGVEVGDFLDFGTPSEYSKVV
jgi:NDP-sugar pyrophosphorylase family protein